MVPRLSTWSQRGGRLFDIAAVAFAAAAMLTAVVVFGSKATERWSYADADPVWCAEQWKAAPPASVPVGADVSIEAAAAKTLADDHGGCIVAWADDDGCVSFALVAPQTWDRWACDGDRDSPGG